MSYSIISNAKIVTLHGTQGYGLIKKGAIVIGNGQIYWVGKLSELPPEYNSLTDRNVEGALVTPGLIDCHTHLVFGGDRSKEFEMRLNGASYKEIAEAGGGIVSTVKETRASPPEFLLKTALNRLDHLIAEGVTTVEIKSGYGLDLETELKMLRVARSLADRRQVRIKTTFLGAHTVPREYIGRAQEYIEDICLPTMRIAKQEKLIDAVDGFCEEIAFSSSELRPIFAEAKNNGLPIKLHAEQLSHQGGVKLATEFGALSVDHLEYATEEDAACMAKSGSVAVLLPGAFYTLRETQLPPINAFRKFRIPIALATDSNPGSSPMTSLLLAMNMGCTLFSMTPEESLRAVTINAALALGLKFLGKIAPGYSSDLAIWDASHPAELSYRIGQNPLRDRIFGGL